MSNEPNAAERKDDNPFDPKNHKLYNEYMNIRSVLDKTNVENGIDMTSADLGRTSLAAMRYLKGQELSRSNRLDPDSPIDGASLSKANPHTGVAAGQYMAFYQGSPHEYEKLRVQGVPTSELGHPAQLSIQEIRAFEAELQQRQMTIEQAQQRDRTRDDPQQNAPSRSFFS
ncbi:MAG: hypothetical protein E6Q50_10080 [Lysobacter sp.]|nr:MAG: hypothetical protein E6Q50_10080 [Lysobacter sp.]